MSKFFVVNCFCIHLYVTHACNGLYSAFYKNYMSAPPQNRGGGRTVHGLQHFEVPLRIKYSTVVPSSAWKTSQPIITGLDWTHRNTS